MVCQTGPSIFTKRTLLFDSGDTYLVHWKTLVNIQKTIERWFIVDLSSYKIVISIVMLVYQRAMWLKTSWWYVSTDEFSRRTLVEGPGIEKTHRTIVSSPVIRAIIDGFFGSLAVTGFAFFANFAGIQCWEGLWCQEQVPKGWRT